MGVEGACPRAGHFRLACVAALLVVTPLGFAFKYYQGPLHHWFNDYGAGVLYEVFWVVLGTMVFSPARPSWKVPAVVFAVTCALEFLQLWHPAFLETLRATFLGRALLGTTFVWLDFPHYVLGCALGYLLLLALASATATVGRP